MFDQEMNPFMEAQIALAKRKAQEEFDQQTFHFGPPNYTGIRIHKDATQLSIQTPPYEEREIDAKIRKAHSIAETEFQERQDEVRRQCIWHSGRDQNDKEEKFDEMWHIYDTLFTKRPDNFLYFHTPYASSEHVGYSTSYSEIRKTEDDYEMADSETVTSFAKFDRNVGCEILKRCDIQSIGRLAGVNKWWNQLTQNKNVWISLHERMTKLRTIARTTASSPIVFVKHHHNNNHIFAQAVRKLVQERTEEDMITLVRKARFPWEEEDKEDEKIDLQTVDDYKCEVIKSCGDINRGSTILPFQEAPINFAGI